MIWAQIEESYTLGRFLSRLHPTLTSRQQQLAELLKVWGSIGLVYASIPKDPEG